MNAEQLIGFSGIRNRDRPKAASISAWGLSSVSEGMLFETNGTDQQQADQEEYLRVKYCGVRQLSGHVAEHRDVDFKKRLS